MTPFRATSQTGRGKNAPHDAPGHLPARQSLEGALSVGPPQFVVGVQGRCVADDFSHCKVSNALKSILKRFRKGFAVRTGRRDVHYRFDCFPLQGLWHEADRKSGKSKTRVHAPRAPRERS